MAKFGVKSFIGGILVGTVGLELLRSKNADKVFVPVTAGVLVAKDWVMKRVELISARATDVYADAKAKAQDYLDQQRAEEAVEQTAVRGEDE